MGTVTLARGAGGQDRTRGLEMNLLPPYPLGVAEASSLSMSGTFLLPWLRFSVSGVQRE